MTANRQTIKSKTKTGRIKKCGTYVGNIIHVGHIIKKEDTNKVRLIIIILYRPQRVSARNPLKGKKI